MGGRIVAQPRPARWPSLLDRGFADVGAAGPAHHRGERARRRCRSRWRRAAGVAAGARQGRGPRSVAARLAADLAPVAHRPRPRRSIAPLGRRPPAERWAIQLGAFRDEAAAEQVARQAAALPIRRASRTRSSRRTSTPSDHLYRARLLHFSRTGRRRPPARRCTRNGSTAAWCRPAPGQIRRRAVAAVRQSGGATPLGASSAVELLLQPLEPGLARRFGARDEHRPGYWRRAAATSRRRCCTRTPSMSIMSAPRRRRAASRTSSTTANLRASAQGKRSSGVLTTARQAVAHRGEALAARAPGCRAAAPRIERVVDSRNSGRRRRYGRSSRRRAARRSRPSCALISEWPVAPHQRRAAHARDLVEQHLARLDVGDDRRAGMAARARRAPARP